MSGCHNDFPLHKLNSGSFHHQGVLPLPPADGLTVRINNYDDEGVSEPRFDPKIHLDLRRPKYVRLFPDFDKADRALKVDSNAGSRFGFSSPFQVLSAEGVRVAKEIAFKNQPSAVGPGNIRGTKTGLRGGYYLSPWLRDLQNCKELLDFFEEFVGEPLIPHCTFSNVPQINISIPGLHNAPSDPWHYDSVAYTGVILLNDMEGLEGGELELMKMEKHKGLGQLAAGRIKSGVHTEIVSYESPGKMILAQGSEILHHVTPVYSSHQRISMVIAYSPANCYQPTKSVLSTMRVGDAVHNLADYEFFREKAWQCSGALMGYVQNVKYSSDGKVLSRYLEAVAKELHRASDLLESVTEDHIDFFDEVKGEVTIGLREFTERIVRDSNSSAGNDSWRSERDEN